MKKSLALILAAMMVAGTASVAFAADTDIKPADVVLDGTFYVYNDDENYYVEDSMNGKISFGDKIAFGLKEKDGRTSVSLSKEVRGVKAFPEYKVGSELVESPKVEYVKFVTEYPTYTKRTLSSTATYKFPSDYKIAAVAGKEFPAIDLTGINNTSVTVISDSDAAKVKAVKAEVAKLVKEKYDTTGEAPWNTLNPEERAAVEADVTENLFLNNVYEYDASGSGKTAYRYMVTMKVKDATSTATKDLYGDMKVGTSSSAAKNNPKFSFNLNVEHEGDRSQIDDASYTVKGEKNWVIDFKNDETVDIEWTSDNENTTYALYTVDATGQGKLNVGFSTKYNSEVAAKYPDANIDFISFTASPIFNRTGDLYIYADEDSYIYEVTADGLKEISKAEYDETYEAWYLKTRKLSSYAISDIELDVKASQSSSEASSSETSSSNPSTGGSTDTTNGNTNVKPNPNTGR